MPRGPRLVYKNAVINITSRGNNKRIIFKKDKDYRYFKALLLKYKKRYKFKLYHYCLMRNHIHLLLKIAETSSLSKIMQGIQLAYFHYFRRRYGYVGRFWQGKFYSKLVEDDKYLLSAGLYIEANPYRSGIVDNPSNYKWSSFNAYAHGAKDSLIDLNPYYLGLSEDMAERHSIYQKIMLGYLKKDKTENDRLYLIVE